MRATLDVGLIRTRMVFVHLLLLGFFLVPIAKGQEARPTLQITRPTNGTSFLPYATSAGQIDFSARDSIRLPDLPFKFKLNGGPLPGGNIADNNPSGGTFKFLQYFYRFPANVDYEFELTGFTTDGHTNALLLHYDTFSPTNPVIQLEQYDFERGRFAEEPFVIPVFDPPFDPVYPVSFGAPDVDYFVPSSTSADTLLVTNAYRPGDVVSVARKLDYLWAAVVAQGQDPEVAADFSLFQVRSGQWLNYTRTLPSDAWHVYLRQFQREIPKSETELAWVVIGAGTTSQIVLPLGRFTSSPTPDIFRNVPLREALGTNRVAVRLEGLTTLRLLERTDDPVGTNLYQNYLILVPANLPTNSVLRPVLTSVSPRPATTNDTATLDLQATILNRDRRVDLQTLTLTFDGQSVVPTVTLIRTNAVLVRHQPLTPPAPGRLTQAILAFRDTDGVEQIHSWSFALNYTATTPTLAVESASSITPGGTLAFEPETGSVVVDLTSRTITVPLSAAANLAQRFYRIRASGMQAGQRVRVVGVTIAGSNLLLRYSVE